MAPTHRLRIPLDFRTVACLDGASNVCEAKDGTGDTVPGVKLTVSKLVNPQQLSVQYVPERARWAGLASQQLSNSVFCISQPFFTHSLVILYLSRA